MKLRMHRQPLLIALVCVSLGSVFSVGCGGSSAATVVGTVTMDGQPLPNARVTFTPKEGGQTAIGKTDSSGKYELYRRDERGAPVGSYEVRVTTIQEPGTAVSSDIPSDSEDYLSQVAGESSRTGSNQSPKETIPARYNTQTTLSFEVEGGPNRFDLELTSDG
jgi:hypothetical protein